MRDRRYASLTKDVLGELKVFKHSVGVRPPLNPPFTVFQGLWSPVEKEEATNPLVVEQYFQSGGQGFAAKSFALTHISKKLEKAAIVYGESDAQYTLHFEPAHHLAEAYDVVTIGSPLFDGFYA